MKRKASIFIEMKCTMRCTYTHTRNRVMLKDESDKKNRQPVNEWVLTLLNDGDAAIDMWVICV